MYRLSSAPQIATLVKSGLPLPTVVKNFNFYLQFYHDAIVRHRPILKINIKYVRNVTGR